jgi:hypothetical protein
LASGSAANEAGRLSASIGVVDRSVSVRIAERQLENDIS